MASVSNVGHTVLPDAAKYFGIPCPNTESQNGECRVDCPDNDAEERNVEIFSTDNGCIAIGVANNDSPLSSGSADVPTVTNAANSQVVSEPSGTTESPTEKNKTSEVADSDTSSPDAPEKPYVPPVIKINLEPEQPVIQQEIVDLYMKSMQQFTESLAKIETSENGENGSKQQDVFIMSSGDGDVSTADVQRPGQNFTVKIYPVECCPTVRRNVTKAYNVLLDAFAISGSILLGFLGGTDGLFAQKTIEITYDILSSFKNQGGFDLLGRIQDQIRTSEQVNAAKVACEALKLNGLGIIGGVTSNTDAAHLAETFVEADVGFDTICRVNSQLISNICLDALSAEKYYYFIRLMGHKASHVAVECTLHINPNMIFLAEEVAMSKVNLFDITKQISDAVQARAEQGKYHGVMLIPEGLVESIPELFALLQEIRGLQSQGVDMESISSPLSPWASAIFEFLSPFIRKQFLLPPESDNSAQFSEIEIEKLLAQLVDAEMNKRIGDLSSFDENEHKVFNWGNPLHVLILKSAFKVFDPGI
ncbi:pyrophosphate--fructose 6-phosphate 1-phosphotransferase subunit alpha-like [Dendrobium catenatum]|uniref:Pyrophosphate--fructose 6-phosphate 1-phosphotransferase subunit alpha n=1 Tax=Dendrobium catenatum TaxID=906689 RepID=A0A2I0V734_9ASPA|nr:pyrophosphate--fructose 6-phosphate 1-phosphotransferase subunit alpha-like [Dendrobium catenatum]PKU59218.1 Pyrophosphate--fructose 6-phosphate 1-phosphotransferase subunit alpha [Dendrobium catenatum]